MNADSAEKCLQDTSAFLPKTGHRFLDLWATGDASEPLRIEETDDGWEKGLSIETWIRQVLHLLTCIAV